MFVSHKVTSNGNAWSGEPDADAIFGYSRVTQKLLEKQGQRLDKSWTEYTKSIPKVYRLKASNPRALADFSAGSLSPHGLRAVEPHGKPLY